MPTETGWVTYTGWVTWTVGTTSSFDVATGTGTLDASFAWTSRQWLFPPVGETSVRAIDPQYTSLMAYISRIHGGSPPLAVGIQELGETLATKVRTVQDIRVGEAIRQTLAAKPDASCWVDYTVEPPTLNVRVASLELPRVLDVRLKADGVVDYPVTVRDDLIPSMVCVRWEGPGHPYTGRAPLRWLTKWPLSGVVTYHEDAMVQTITDKDALIPGGYTQLARKVYEALAVRRSTGSIVLRDLDFAEGWRPGSVLYLTGDAMLEGVQHLVQGVSWSPATGQTTLSVGYPQHLSLTDRMAIQQAMRQMWYPLRWANEQVSTMPGA